MILKFKGKKIINKSFVVDFVLSKNKKINKIKRESTLFFSFY